MARRRPGEEGRGARALFELRPCHASQGQTRPGREATDAASGLRCGLPPHTVAAANEAGRVAMLDNPDLSRSPWCAAGSKGEQGGRGGARASTRGPVRFEGGEEGRPQCDGDAVAAKTAGGGGGGTLDDDRRARRSNSYGSQSARARWQEDVVGGDEGGRGAAADGRQNERARSRRGREQGRRTEMQSDEKEGVQCRTHVRSGETEQAVIAASASASQSRPSEASQSWARVGEGMK